MRKSNKPHIELDSTAAQSTVESAVTLESAETPAERRAIWWIIAVTMVLTSLPFLYGMFLDGPNHRFVGQVYNVDDYCVYSSWVTQIVHGSFFIRNLFTTEPQLGKTVNVFFIAVGEIVRFGHISLPWVMAIIRLIGGIALLWLVSRFYRSMLPGSRMARTIAFALTALGTGFGWLFASSWADRNDLHLPVDTWQPEAFPFLSLDTSALFVVATLLIVATIWLLLEGERTGKMRYAAYAGLCGLLLGDMHSYDILHIVAAWAVFLVVRDVANRRLRGDSWLRALVAGLVAMPSVAYQFYLFNADHAFHNRAAKTFTHSQGIDTYLLGYGLIFFMAAIGCILAFKSERFIAMWRSRDERLLPICWAIAAFVLVYVKTAFQRKMIMGVDFPLCLLAGATLAYFAASLGKVRGSLVIAMSILLSLPTGLLFIGRDLRHAAYDRSETFSLPYLSDKELDLFNWISANTKPGESLAGPPTLMIYVPGFCDRTVWCGHWSESPNYAENMRRYGMFSNIRDNSAGADLQRRAFLESTKAQYLVALNYPAAPSFPTAAGPVPYLEQVYPLTSGAEGYVVYRIHVSRGIVARGPVVSHLSRRDI